MKPLRIVQVVPSFVVGGAETFALALAEAQLAAGHDVHLVSITEGGPLSTRFSDALDGRVWTAGKRSRWDVTVLGRMLKIFRRLQPDVVNTHLFTSLAWASVTARAAGVPTIVHTQHEVHDDDQWYLPAVRRALAHGLDAIVGCSAATVEDVHRRRYAPGIPVELIENGVPLGGRPRAALDGQPLVVGTVGRLVPIKGQRFLVEAIGLLRDQGTHVRLVIAGDGESMGELTEQVRALSLGDRVTLLGRVDDVPQQVARFDLFALPSLSEAMPMALIEAAAAGLPLLVTTGGGGPTLLEAGAGGWAVAPGDAPALAVKIAAYASMSVSARRELGDASHAVAHARYDIGATAARYVALYDRLGQAKPR